MNHDEMLKVVQRIIDLAFMLKSPNMICPGIIQCCVELRMLINWHSDNEPGLTPKGKPMPQTKKEYQYLCDLYEHGLFEAKAENNKLRIKINNQAQRLDKQHITIKNFFETSNES